MKTMNRIAAQGEAFFRRVDSTPETGLVEVQPENGFVIVAHSETGHHHVMEAAGVTLMEHTVAPEGLRILHMIVKEPTVLEHLRPNDTHEPILFNPGTYEVRLQREYTPEGYRRVAD